MLRRRQCYEETCQKELFFHKCWQLQLQLSYYVLVKPIVKLNFIVTRKAANQNVLLNIYKLMLLH